MAKNDGTPVTVIFAKHMVNMIEAKNMSPIYYPEGFDDGKYGEHSSYECKENECHKSPDGRWITNQPTADRAHRFFWRIEPNYNCYGKPSFSAEKKKDLFNKSETKKVIHETNKHSICLEWFKFDLPTEVIWGLGQGPVYITIYEGNEKVWTGKTPIDQRGWKKEFTDFIVEYFKWPGPDRK